MKRQFVAPALCVVLCGTAVASAGEREPEPWRVLPKDQLPNDARLKPLRTLRDEYHPWQPPENLPEWKRERERIRRQILVSNGLWPLPEKLPLSPVIHGKIDRGEYTVEKVYFASHPGHYVTGNLYRPRQIEGKVPGVLCPHGHWANGRLYDAGEQAARQQIDQGAEKHLSGARYPLQARMAQLARLGCIVFHYDMVGYADSTALEHRGGFADVEAGLRLQNWMGLQTWNSLRALDFLLSLPEVDPQRIGVTGASGGGTQTFILCAVDDRPAVAFPAVMVSTNMQGGCVCENADYLRIGVNNIAFAALFAPKPLAMSGADDWTIDIETKGLPELRQVYSLYGQPDLVHAKCFPQFKHNYNQVAREMMYAWFNAHLNLGHKEPIEEQEFEPIPPAELRVFDTEHPQPADVKNTPQLRQYLTETANRQFAALLPSDAQGLAEYRRIVGAAASVLLSDPAGQLERNRLGQAELDADTLLVRQTLGRRGAGEEIPLIELRPRPPEAFNGTAVVWVDGRGKQALFDGAGRPIAAVRKLLAAGRAVLAPDVCFTGEFQAREDEPKLPEVNAQYAGYTFGYNRPVLSNRVRDVLTALAAAGSQQGIRHLQLVGTGEAGLWVLLARGLAGERVELTIADLHGFGFGKVTSTADPNYLPGALKYGGVGGLAALAAPGKLVLAGTKEVLVGELEPLEAVYRAVGGKLVLREAGLTPDDVAGELVRN